MDLTMYALYKMLYETCGEEEDVLKNAKITEISKNTFHIQYEENNPYDGMDFKVNLKLDRLNGKPVCYYTISESVYGDDGAFRIDLVSR